MSARSYLSIGDVLGLLQAEFPDVTISKIRFLESQGLVNPERTPSGYRKFYDDDVERLRWVLRQQREHFLPLKVIKGRLDAGRGGYVEPGTLDLGYGEADPVEPGEPGLAGSDGCHGGPGDADRSDGSLETSTDLDASSRPSSPRSTTPSGSVAPGGAQEEPRTSVSGAWAVAGLSPTPVPATRRSGAGTGAPGQSPLVPADRRAAAPEHDAQRRGAPASTPGARTPGAVLGGSVPGAGRPGPSGGSERSGASGGSRAPGVAYAGGRPASALSPPGAVQSGGAVQSSGAVQSPGAVQSGEAGTSTAAMRSTASARSVSPEGASGTVASGPSSGPAGSGIGAVGRTCAELMAVSGLDEAAVAELAAYGLVRGRTVGDTIYYDEDEVAVATVVAGFARFGVEVRHLRMHKNAAEREAGFIEQIVLPLVKQRNPEARQRAADTVTELGDLGRRLRAALLSRLVRERFG